MPDEKWTFFKRFKRFLNRADKGIHYKAVFGSTMGQEVLRDLYNECGMGRCSAIVGDPYGTAFNEGRRSVFLDITKKMGIDPAELEQEICDE